jgi:hypothetical protein
MTEVIWIVAVIASLTALVVLERHIDAPCEASSAVRTDAVRANAALEHHEQQAIECTRECFDGLASPLEPGSSRSEWTDTSHSSSSSRARGIAAPAMSSHSARNSPQADLAAIEAAVKDYVVEHGGLFPDSLSALVTPDNTGKLYLSNSDVLRDPWGREYMYAPPAPNAPSHVFTYGRDGRLGGTGDDADFDRVLFDDDVVCSETIRDEEAH